MNSGIDPDSDSGGDSGRDPARDPGNDPARDPGNDPARDPGNDSARDSSRDSSRDSGRDSGRDPGNDPARDPGNDSGRDPGSDSDSATLESRLRRLDEIVASLEGGDVELERGLALFEEGVTHIRAAESLLSQAELRVEELVGRVDALEVRPFEGEGAP